MNLSQQRIIEFALRYLRANLDEDVVSNLTGVEEPDKDLMDEVEDALRRPVVVYGALVNHENGIDTYLSLSREIVNQKVFDFVEAWWDEELPYEKMPEDRQEAIDMYFELVEKEYIDVFAGTILGGE